MEELAWGATGWFYLQFICRNTLNDQVLENVTISLVGESDELQLERTVPIPLLKYDVVQSTYSIFRKPDGAYPSGKELHRTTACRSPNVR